MTDYERGFDAGERQAFKNRRNAVRVTRPQGFLSEYERGYWDGYTPRSQAWGLSRAEAPWWAEREVA